MPICGLLWQTRRHALTHPILSPPDHVSLLLTFPVFPFLRCFRRSALTSSSSFREIVALSPKMFRWVDANTSSSLSLLLLSPFPLSYPVSVRFRWKKKNVSFVHRCLRDSSCVVSAAFRAESDMRREEKTRRNEARESSPRCCWVIEEWDRILRIFR